MTLPDPPLLLVTDRRQAPLPLTDIVAAALEGGCRWISVREKDLPLSGQIAIAQSLLPLARRYDARLTLHGDGTASVENLDGTHLPDGSDAGAARKRLGSGKLVGQSVHDAATAAALDPTILDYVIAGPAFESASKPGYGPILGGDGLAAIVRSTKIPVIAIGGVTEDNIAQVIASGAAGAAVMGAVMRAREPEKTMRGLLAALQAARSQPRPR